MPAYLGQQRTAADDAVALYQPWQFIVDADHSHRMLRVEGQDAEQFQIVVFALSLGAE